MTWIDIALTPIAGAVIGYFTNWLAVKMLFRPHNPMHIGKAKLPLTPGLIPKERERMAATLGETVGNHLLTREALLEHLTSEKMLQGLDAGLTDAISFLQTTDITLEEGLQQLLGEKSSALPGLTSYLNSQWAALLSSSKLQNTVNDFLFEKTDAFLSQYISDLPLDTMAAYAKDFLILESKDLLENGILHQTLEQSLWQYLLKLKEDERSLQQLLSFENIQSLKDYLTLKTPQIADALLELTEKPEVEEKLKAHLAEAISTVAGAVLSMLVDKNAIYNQLLDALRTYIHDPASQPEIEEAVSLIVDKAMEFSLGSLAALVTSELREVTLNRLVDTALKVVLEESHLTALTDKLAAMLREDPNRTLWDVLLKAEPNLREKLRFWISGLTEKAAVPALSNLVQEGLEQYLSTLWHTPISTLTEKLPATCLEKGKQVLLSRYAALISFATPKLLTAVNVPEVVENQILSFDMPYIESLILSIASKELRSITLVGGVLGFVIGLIPVLLQLV